MKKTRIILGVLVVIVVLCILGLIGYKRDGNNQQNPANNNPYETVEDIIGGANIEDIETVNSGEKSGDESINVGLYSNENRAVFNFENMYYLVYEFDGDNVVGLSYYYAFESESTATLATEHFKTKLSNKELDPEQIEEITSAGSYVIITLKPSMYDETTKQDVMETYSYFEQIYGESGDKK